MILPHHLVRLVNVRYRGLEVEDELLTGALEELAQWEQWWEAESGFWVVEEEQAELDSIQTALGALRKSLGDGHWSLTFEAMRTLNALMSSVNERRSRAPYSPIPALHHCILAGGAVLIGQGDWACLEGRWVMVETYLDNLEAAFRAEIEALPKEAQAALGVGFERAQEGIDQGRLAQDAQSLQEALKRLQEAGELLAFLPRRQQALADELERAAVLKIPIVGGRLESDVRANPEEWLARARLRLEVTLPVLERFVYEEGRGVLLPPGEEGLWDPLDLALAQVRRFYETRPCSQGLSEVLQKLSKAFESVEALRVKPEAQSNHLAERCLRMCRSLLRGEVPDPALAEFRQELADLPSWSNVVEALDDYLDSGEAEALQRAAWAAPAASQKLAGGGTGLSFLAE